MKILLVGEYSRLHNSLKEGLCQFGHEVFLVGFNDGFKDFPVDLRLIKKWDSGIKRKVKSGIFRLTKFDISSWLTYRQFFSHKTQFMGFDVVQLINENAFYCQPFFEIKILKFLFANNQKVFLLSSGDDYVNVNYYFDHPEKKSVIQPYLQGKIKDKDFLGVLKFRTDGFRKLHHFLYSHINGTIATDMDYHIPLIGNPKYVAFIPNPVNTDKIHFNQLEIKDKIVIFLGINRESYFKKGSDYFEAALDIIKAKYPKNVEIIVTRSLPYSEYITAYERAHILLDQTFSHDQGYNALEAMAKGKVVFSGAEPQFIEHYGVGKRVNVNAVADTSRIVESISSLIENPAEIQEVGRCARQFIETSHFYTKVAARYVDTWINT